MLRAVAAIPHEDVVETGTQLVTDSSCVPVSARPSDGPGRARPKIMRTAWRSGTPRSGTATGTCATMRVSKPAEGNAVAEPASWTETDRSARWGRRID